MADNYLEKRYEETLGANRPKVKRIGNTVDTLLLRSRSHRGFNKNYVVSRAASWAYAPSCPRAATSRYCVIGW